MYMAVLKRKKSLQAERFDIQATTEVSNDLIWEHKQKVDIQFIAEIRFVLGTFPFFVKRRQLSEFMSSFPYATIR